MIPLMKELIRLLESGVSFNLTADLLSALRNPSNKENVKFTESFKHQKSLS